MGSTRSPQGKRDGSVTYQTASQLILLVGILLSAAGGFGSYYFGKMEDQDKQRGFDAQIANLQTSMNQNTELLYEALDVKKDVWIPVEIKSVPPGVTDYLLLLFRSDKGRISGKVRVQGSNAISTFSTTANNTIAIAVPNVWVSSQQMYKMPTVLEFAVTEKTDPNAALSILTQGWIDRRGQEPH